MSRRSGYEEDAHRLSFGGCWFVYFWAVPCCFLSPTTIDRVEICSKNKCASSSLRGGPFGYASSNRRGRTACKLSTGLHLYPVNRAATRERIHHWVFSLQYLVVSPHAVAKNNSVIRFVASCYLGSRFSLLFLVRWGKLTPYCVFKSIQPQISTTVKIQRRGVRLPVKIQKKFLFRFRLSKFKLTLKWKWFVNSYFSLFVEFRVSSIEM